MFYNILLRIAQIVLLPKFLLQRKYRGTVAMRLGLRLPKIPQKKKMRIWLHAVSVGELKAALPIIKHYSDVEWVISTVTATGLAEAKKQVPRAIHFILPLDLASVMIKLIERVDPDLVLLSEGDFWYNMLHQLGVPITLINGKISQKSMKHFLRCRSFAQKLFSQIDHFCVQSEEHKERFLKLGVSEEKLEVTGNLKWELSPPILSSQEKETLRERFGIEDEFVITIGSTHPGEEKALLEKIPLDEVKVLLCPRHPERFEEVRALCNHPSIILVDEMGLLTSCYQISDLAIVGGSFIKGIGGHNILEPIYYHVPVLFGPYMEKQKELVSHVLGRKAGLQINLEKLSTLLSYLIEHDEKRSALVERGKQLLSEQVGAVQATVATIDKNNFVLGY